MTTPSHPTDAPAPEAMETARSALLEIGCCFYGSPSPTTEIARALDAFAAAAVERVANMIDCGGPNGCSSWATKSGRGHKRGNGYCVVHEGYCAHDLADAIRSGEQP